MDNGLPIFRYHCDPVQTAAVEHVGGVCDCCGQEREWKYQRNIYTAVSPRYLCPWCIADGRAAAKFDAQFHDVDFGDGCSRQSQDDVLFRTPGFSTWNPIEWPGHHGECCAYVGTVDDDTYAPLLEQQSVREEAERLARGIARHWTADDLVRSVRKGGITVHLFQCLTCSAYRLSLDGT